jgi:hypothetical protein
LACAKHLFARLPVGCQLYANGAAVTLAPKEHAAFSNIRHILVRFWTAAQREFTAGLSRQICRPHRDFLPQARAAVDLSRVVHNFFKFPRASNLIQARNFSETPSRPPA